MRSIRSARRRRSRAALGGFAAAVVGWMGSLAATPATAAREGVLWQTAPDTPFSFTRFDAEWSPTTKRIFFLGGRLGDAALSTDGSIWSFDPETGMYADTLVDMPVPISNYTIARLLDESGEEILVTFGGRNAAGAVIDTVQGYYPGSNTTRTFAADPYPVATIPGGVAVVDNIAYSFGGFDPLTSVIAATHFFDVTAADGARWTDGPDLNLARGYISAATVDGLIYAVGGDTWDGTALHAVQVVERLDPENPTAWDDAGVADLPAVGTGPDFGCDQTRAFGFDTGTLYDVQGLIILAGCGQWRAAAPPPPGELPESMSYDVALNSWDAAGFPDLNLSRRNHAGAFIPFGGGSDGRPGVWVWGGRFDADTTLRITPEFYAVGPGLLFADGYESGDLTAWSFLLP